MFPSNVNRSRIPSSYFLRSQQMNFFRISIERESAWEIINEIGEENKVHFYDRNPEALALGRPFTNQIRRCDEIFIKLVQIENEIKKMGKSLVRCTEPIEFINNYKEFIYARNMAPHTLIDEIEFRTDCEHDKLMKNIKNLADLNLRIRVLIDYNRVLKKTKPIICDKYLDFHYQPVNNDDSINNNDVEMERIDSKSIKIHNQAGVIFSKDQMRLSRMIFRISKGNAHTEFFSLSREEVSEDQIPFSEEDKKEPRIVFMILYSGQGNHKMMERKLDNLCRSFSLNVFKLPENPVEFQREIIKTEQELDSQKKVCSLTIEQIEASLDVFVEPRNPHGIVSYIEELQLIVQKELALYHTLNKMESSNAFFSGYFWIPTDDKDEFSEKMKRKYNSKVELTCINPEYSPRPPTLLYSNKFLKPFQDIVNTYGIPRYREINPGFFTIVTFPFLFGMMFGDIAHGLILFLFGSYMCLYYDKLRMSKSVIVDLLSARYLILMMGFFAFYSGIIYNDFASLALNLFGTCYDTKSSKRIDKCVYGFGVDPIWSITTNELSYMNSLKMKLSVIIGVIHMLLGVVLKGFNAINGKNKIDFWFEFLPQFLFLFSTFGYMIILVFIKWVINWENITSKAPSIINLLLDMPLKGGAVSSFPLWGDGSSQSFTNKIMLSIVCVPLMLFPKPLILLNNRKKHNNLEEKKNSVTHYEKGSDSDKEKLIKAANEDDEEVEMQINIDEKEGFLKKKTLNGPSKSLSSSKADGKKIPPDPKRSFLSQEKMEEEVEDGIFIHQVIETIEFVLGSISNTASYLRLWALSLAHSQLAEVFYEMSLEGSIKRGNTIGVIFGFFLFANITFGVLMCMDCLECFLHALRLHWVEFQNKFYKADGYLFEAFSFENENLTYKPKADYVPY